jgi:hypothetical protein
MAAEQITDFGYNIFLTPRSVLVSGQESIFTGITVHSPSDDVSDQVNEFCVSHGLNAREYQIRKDLILYV